MTTILSILALLAVWALLANVERLQWPPQRDSAIHDVQYWQAVKRDSAAYLAVHTNASAEIRAHVEALAQAAQQRLGGLAR